MEHIFFLRFPALQYLLVHFRFGCNDFLSERLLYREEVLFCYYDWWHSTVIINHVKWVSCIHALWSSVGITQVKGGDTMCLIVSSHIPVRIFLTNLVVISLWVVGIASWCFVWECCISFVTKYLVLFFFPYFSPACYERG